MSVQAYWDGRGTRWLVRAGVGLILGWVLAGLVLARSGVAAEEPSGPRFVDWERVAQYLDSNPVAAVNLLEGVLSQTQIDALERAMFPEPGDAEKSTVYCHVATELKRLGLPADDALLQEVSARAEATAAASTQEGTP